MEEPSGKFFTSDRGIEYCNICKDNFKRQYFGKRCTKQQTINKMSCPLQINIISKQSKFNMKQIIWIANSVADCWLLLASPHLLKLFVHFTKVFPQCKFKLTDNKRQCKEVMNNGQKVLISKTKQGVFYCVYEKSVFEAIESIASDESRMVYYDTSNGSFCEEIPHICKLKNRQVKKTERKTLYRGLIRNNNKSKVLVNLKMCRFYTCPSRPISLKRKCQYSGVVPDGNVFPLSPTSYPNDNYPTSIVAQASDHDTDDIDYLSTISSQQEDGSPHAFANRFSQYSLRLNNSAYRDYMDRDARKSSFTRQWPHPVNFVGLDDMINCGFFYTGREDLVRCFYCGIGLKDWSEFDDPLAEHVRYSPDCQYLNGFIPSTRLKEIKASFLPNNVVSTRESHRTNDAGFEPVPDQETVVLPVEPRSPQYARLPVRIASFTKWPQDITQTPEELAEAGFFYTGCNDIVRCYVCDGGLQKWSQGDNAWIEHARWFPHCSYVRVIKGEDFVELVRLSAENEDLEEEGSLQGAAAFSDDISRGISRLNVSEDHKESHTNWDVINKVRDATGIPEEQIRRAIDIMKRAGQNLTEDAVANFLLDKTNQFTESQSFSQKEPESTEELQHENETLKSIVKCMHCRDNDANCLFLPCAHHRLCMACSVSVSTCPVCGKQIYNKVKTFMS